MSLARYAGVGALATLAHYSFMTLLIEVGSVSAGFAAAIGALLGAVIAYVGNRRWTFSSSSAKHRTAVLKFAATAAIGAAVSGGLVSALASIDVHYLLAQCMATLAVLLLTYRLNRSWTFQ